MLKLSAKLIIAQAWRAYANLFYPFPTLVLYQVFAGLSRVYGKFMKIFCVFRRFRHEGGVVSRPAPRRSSVHFYEYFTFSIDNANQLGYNITIFQKG